MKKGRPIRPDEVHELKTVTIPAEVFDAFNECIAKVWNGRSARIVQESVVLKILEKMPGLHRRTIFENHWLDVEEAYRAQGWTVFYDKPGFDERYEAYFVFQIKE